MSFVDIWQQHDFAQIGRSIQAKTAADVQRVARQYLVEDRSTTGWFIPLAGEGGGSRAPGHDRRPG